MAMNSNFERLEQEVNRLVEVLNSLREENSTLKGQIRDFEEQAQQARGEIGRLQQVESEYKEANQTRDEIRGRIENLLTRLDGLEL
jgi:chromosome segregation ATPase